MTAHTPTKGTLPLQQRNAMSVFAPLQREFNRFFDELGDGFATFGEAHFTPRMDLVETKSGLELTVEAPGLTAQEIKVTADGDVLTISGEKTTSSEKTEGTAHVAERSFGRFSRSIALPRTADPAKITAAMKDGVLKIEIPKRADAKVQTIEIASK